MHSCPVLQDDLIALILKARCVVQGNPKRPIDAVKGAHVSRLHDVPKGLELVCDHNARSCAILVSLAVGKELDRFIDVANRSEHIPDVLVGVDG